ncbi:hypothetical protein KDW49_27615 [Burkholderia dolosa]|uniref:hypothetical protein n=1 Tax=Burkholderia dolosa TaxID=152500 RepID=UPI001B9B3705|nr:hypothetical protein [Burkholderia dolosa]MBR8304480.1 hypothetical protein [Burkholderia dolosa]
MEFEFGHVPVLFGTSGGVRRGLLDAARLPSAKGRSIVERLLPVGAIRGVIVASLRPILNAGVRTRWNSGRCDDRRADAQRDKKRR